MADEGSGSILDKLRYWWDTPIEKIFDKQLASLTTELNDYNYDDFGFSPEWVKRSLLFAALIYRYYFRVELYGAANLPQGRAVLVSNHSGQIPIDGAMISTGLLLEGDPPRALRSMVERWVPTLPFVSELMPRLGQVLGAPENARGLLEREEALLVFPEGVRGINKTFKKRYQLAEFGSGFMRLALETNAPIVPVAVIGAEEQFPSLANMTKIGKLFGAPGLPLLPQLLVPVLGWAPLPVKYRIHIGEAIRFTGDANDEDIIIEEKVKAVRERVQQMINYGLGSRRNIFW